MFTVKGRVVNGRIQLDHPNLALPDSSDLIVSFPDLGGNQVRYQNRTLNDGLQRGHRLHPRHPFTGKITIIEADHASPSHYQLPLLDVSLGGLSFLSNRHYLEESPIRAGITAPDDPADIWLELDLEVRGVTEVESGFKVGCMFRSSLDERLWYGLNRILR